MFKEETKILRAKKKKVVPKTIHRLFICHDSKGPVNQYAAALPSFPSCPP